MPEPVFRFTTSGGEPRDGIACPLCGFVPWKGMQWHCSPDGCGTLFDTFETHARCPQCDAQFAWTACPACNRASAHSAWYGSAVAASN